MKKYRAAQIISGLVFFAIAAFFSFSLLNSLITDGTGANGFTNFSCHIGELLRNTYGFCSILIPVFFFVVSMICLIAKITFKKCIYISFSLIPFFTAVLSEYIYKSRPHNMLGAIETVKLILTIIATILIMAIEILLSGIIAERIAVKIAKSRKGLNADSSEIEDEEIISDFNSGNKKFAFERDSITENLKYTDKPSFINENHKRVPVEDAETDIFSDKTIVSDETIIADETVSEEDLEHDSLENQFNTMYAQEDEEPEVVDDFDNITLETNNDEIEIDIPNDFEEETDSGEENDFSNSDADIQTGTDENINEETDIKPEVEETVKADISEPEGVADVFSQMDADIEKKYGMDSEQDSVSQQYTDSINITDSVSSSDDETSNDFETVSETPAAPVATKSVKEAEREIKEEKKSSRKIRKGPYKVPTEGLLEEFEDQEYWVIDGKTNDASAQLKETLEEFKIAAEVTGIRKGPVVTMFEILPAPGVKLSKIVQLQDNIALRLAASSVRIVAPIPGKRAVGIEVPNENRAIVTFRELIEQNLPEYKKMAVPVVLGKDIQGEAQLLDIAKTPHLLIAGSTGSGKSVCVNSIILSILYKRTPEQVKLILVDPKIVELKLYNDIPHLLTPVITEPKKALQSLQYCLCEMERRYALLDGLGCRDIVSYNKRIEERHIATEKLPYIVVIIDEFADLMATTGKELESTIARLCAMSRAVGIHLVLATQRPSIDVITGLIKANIPTRIAFMVASKMDSRIIIDQVGAEKLLGRGDMLYASATDPFPVRIQGTYVSDDEVENVVEYVKGFGEPEYIDDEIFVETEDDEMAEPGLFGGSGEDPLYNKALEIVMQAGKASASYLQRRLSIGYNRAARLVEDMEARGIVGPANGSKPREIIHVPN